MMIKCRHYGSETLPRPEHFTELRCSTGSYDGFGLHVEDIPRPNEDIVRDTKLDLFILEVFYVSSLSFSKLSVLAFYWRIFNSVRSAQIMILTLAIVAIVWMVARVSH